MSNIEHRILNGEAEIGGVLRGGWFNRFLDKLGMTRGLRRRIQTRKVKKTFDGKENLLTVIVFLGSSGVR